MFEKLYTTEVPRRTSAKRQVAIYARVSSADQREDLERQKQRLVELRARGYKPECVQTMKCSECEL
jgi:predicted site-specific integrase-resolvase